MSPDRCAFRAETFWGQAPERKAHETRHHSRMTLTEAGTWPHLDASFDDGGRVPLGLLLLATDRASGADIDAFLPASVEAYGTRIPMDVVATPETLARLGDHLTEGARLLAPGGPLA